MPNEVGSFSFSDVFPVYQPLPPKKETGTKIYKRESLGNRVEAAIQRIINPTPKSPGDDHLFDEPHTRNPGIVLVPPWKAPVSEPVKETPPVIEESGKVDGLSPADKLAKTLEDEGRLWAFDFELEDGPIK